MALTTLVIDVLVPYGRSSRRSLLSLPLGETSVLGHLLEHFHPLGASDVLVLPRFPNDVGYREAIGSIAPSSVRVVDSGLLAGIVGNCETSDYVLIVEPRFWPVICYDFSSDTRLSDYRGATHVVAVGASDIGTVRERLECDPHGNVKRVQRLYGSVNWPEVAASTIAYSVVPGRALDHIGFDSLTRLRSALSEGGILSRDVPLESAVFDLSRERDFLALNERAIAGKYSRPGSSRAAPADCEVLVGQRCRIHPTARLIPPVVVQNDVVIQEDVTVVGPTVVGAASTIERNAQVVQSVLDRGAVVPAGATIRHRVAMGDCPTLSSGATKGVLPEASIPHPFERFLPLEEPERIANEAAAARRWVHAMMKRAIDVVLASLALLVLSPFMLVMALVIKLDSHGPVLFTHRREGRNGKEFPCWKFRTMAADAHRQQRELYKQNELDGPQFKLGCDPRLTRVGCWIRATNIDELPQLIDVLLGHMSLVGPRPSPFRENQVCVPWRRARLSVRPGISGLWQVCRNQDRSQGDFHEWIFYDVAYVRHFSIWLDIKILLATLVSLGGRWSVPFTWMIPGARESAGWSERLIGA